MLSQERVVVLCYFRITGGDVGFPRGMWYLIGTAQDESNT